VKKIYTIRIIGTRKSSIWYRTRKLEEFEAEIAIVRGKAVFKVDSLHFVNPEDCSVVSERIEKKYQRI
jgi:hypothetical protein